MNSDFLNYLLVATNTYCKVQTGNKGAKLGDAGEHPHYFFFLNVRVKHSKYLEIENIANWLKWAQISPYVCKVSNN